MKRVLRTLKSKVIPAILWYLKMMNMKPLNMTLRKPISPSDIVSIAEQIKGSDYHNDSVTFNYELNEKAARSKLVKGSKRIPFEVEENSTSMNLLFSVGAWLTSVLPAVRYWDEIKEDKVCKVDDIIIKVGGIKSGNDKNGMHVVSQVVFYVDRDKVVCHLYNTTQKILVNGHGYKRLIDIFLKPFFQSKVESCSREIENLRGDVWPSL